MRYILKSIILTLIGCGILAVVHAQPAPRVEVRNSALIVNRTPAIHVRVANGDLLPEHRARIAGERLQAAISRGLRAAHVGVRAERGRAAVTIGGGVLLYATRTDARAAGTTPLRLAQAWARSLRHCLAIPPLSLSSSELLIPLGESRTVRVNTWLEGPAIVAPTGVPDDGITDPAVIGDGYTIQVAAVSVGRERVLVSVGEVSVTLTVTVRKYAGEVKVTEPVIVTGAHVSTGYLRDAVAAAVARFTQLEPGAQMNVTSPVRVGGSLAPNASTTASAQVEISGSGYIPRVQEVKLNVVNRPMTASEPVWLVVSNYPERVQQPQTLFTAEVTENRGTRLLYHHMNGMVQDGLFQIELLNPGDTARSFRIFGAASAPLRDTVRVGYLAGELFISQMLNNLGHVITVPPQSKVVLLAQRIRPLFTVSGVVQMHMLPPQAETARGAPCILKVTMHAFNNQRMQLQGTTIVWGHMPPRPLTPQERNAVPDTEHVYPTSHKVLNATYIVGERWQFIRIGEVAVRNHREQRKLDGNYGVVYELRIELVNPKDTPRDVELVFEPSGGEAGAVFAVEGEVRGVPRVLPPNETRITRMRLLPGQRRSITIRTMPLAGSNYPATLLVRS